MEINHKEFSDGSVFFTLTDDIEITLYSRYITSAITKVNNNPPTYVINYFNNQQKCYIYFSDFRTDRLIRKRGYGRKLLQAVKEYYSGCIVYLGVSSTGEMTNQQLIDFYASEGFEVIEHDDLSFKDYTVMAIEL